MSDLLDIKLYPRGGYEDAFTESKMTIKLDAGGSPMTVSGPEALDQDVLKAMFTGIQADGYGTVIHTVLGEKNIGVIRAMITYTIISTLQKLVNLHMQLTRRFPTMFRGGRALTGVDFITVIQDESNLQRVKVNIDFQTDRDELRQVSGSFVKTGV